MVLLSLVLCEYVQEMGQRRDSIPGFKELPSLLGREGSHQKKFIYTQSYGAGEGMGQRAPRGETSAIGEGWGPLLPYSVTQPKGSPLSPAFCAFALT